MRICYIKSSSKLYTYNCLNCIVMAGEIKGTPILTEMNDIKRVLMSNITR